MYKLLLISLLFAYSLKSQKALDSLIVLDLQHKNLLELPKDIDYLKVGTLHLGYNPIKTISEEILKAKYLKNLTVNYNNQFNFESSLKSLKSLELESFSIDNSNIMYLPLEIIQLKHLKELSLANNYIKEIPEYIFEYCDYSYLNLEGNLIKELPAEIKSQLNLKTLYLSGNPCINNASTYQNLKKLDLLKQLEVRGADNIPVEIWNLEALEVLNMSDGTFNEITIPNEARKNNFKEIIVNNCNNYDFKSLGMILSSNSINEISIGGSRFNGFNNISISSSVKHLTLSGENLNNFTLANSIPNLEELKLNFEKINCYPELINTLSKVNKLKILDLSNTNLTQIPSQISHLKNLEHLNISNNKLQSISELFKMKKLLSLDVSSCNLTQLQIDKIRSELPNTAIITGEAFDKPALPNALPLVETYSVDPQIRQTIVTQNGTTIVIPKNSLIYSNGQAVKEPVTINYTPYYSLAEIAMSGINMNYQDSLINAPFASAGMFKITANAKGQNVDLKKGSIMTVEFKSNDPEQSYNYYSYDTVTNKWDDIGKDSIKTIKVKNNSDTVISTNLISSNSFKFPFPKHYIKNQNVKIIWDLDKKKHLTGIFTINAIQPSLRIKNDTTIGDNYFTDIKYLSKVSWKIDDAAASKKINEIFKNGKLLSHKIESRKFKMKPRYYSSELYKNKMIDFELIADKEHDSFLFKFYDDVDTLSFYAYPQISYKSVDRTQKSIKKIFYNYKTEASKRQYLTNYRKNRFYREYNNYKIELDKVRNQISANQSNEFSQLINSSVSNNSITRIMQLQGFGIYNCDRTVIIQNPIVITPRFYNEHGKKINIINYQVIDLNENIVVSYYKEQKIKLSKNSVITFINSEYSNTASNKVYIGKISTAGFNSSGNVDIQLTLVPSNTTLGDLNDLITSNK